MLFPSLHKHRAQNERRVVHQVYEPSIHRFHSSIHSAIKKTSNMMTIRIGEHKINNKTRGIFAKLFIICKNQ